MPKHVSVFDVTVEDESPVFKVSIGSKF